MTLRERLAAMGDGSWLLIAAPKIEHIITGTSRVGVTKSGVVCIEYEDGKIERRMGDGSVLDGMDTDNLSIFTLVQYVQDGRREAA